MKTIELAERGLIPDALIRWGVRRLSADRLVEEGADDPAVFTARLAERVAEWRAGPIAVNTRDANEQHYELPPAFFEQVLGANLKYSCCWYPNADTTLDEAEEAMLELSCERAGIVDGMRVLDLGCGWGSMALWIGRRYPNCRVTAVSNSALQRSYIEQRARQFGIEGLRVITEDINDFQPDDRFDRIVSVEMLEHVRNHERVFERVAGWLADDGAFFAHVFCHREIAYPYEDRGDDDWMSRYFFTGGVMPSFGLFANYQRHLQLSHQWWVPGTHYERTSNDWLAKMDASAETVRRELRQHYDADEAKRWFHRWRLFFLAVAEFFGYQGGRQWGVGHYLFRRQDG